MASLRWTYAFMICNIAIGAVAQDTSSDILDILVSDGYDIFTQVTSILNTLTDPPASSASPTPDPSTSSPDPSTTSTLSTSSSTTSSPTTSPSPTTASASSTAVAAASAAASSDSSSHHGGGSNKLAIIIGAVLGVVALGLLVLVLLLLCRRRRRRARAARTSPSPPGDAEVESWRQRHRMTESRHGSDKEMLAGSAPLMSEHPAYRSSQDHQNPFAPIPPPPRRYAPNSRAGLTDGMVPGDDPYLMEKGSPGRFYASSSRPSHDGSHKGASAAGVGPTALGAAALHQYHNRDRDSSPASSEHRISRKPVPANMNNGHGASTAAAFGAGALGGAALAHHRHSSSGQSQPRPPMASQAYGSESSNPTESSATNSSNRYSDAVQHQNAPPFDGLGRSDTHELPVDIPSTPPMRSHRNSALGTAAPAAAAAAYRDRSKSGSRSRSRSGSRPRSFPMGPDDYPQYRQDSNAPALPTRSPRRSKEHSRPRHSEYGSTAVPDDSAPHEPKGIVGDNGYPHLGVPRRKSGGQYDHANNGLMGPQSQPRPLPLVTRQESPNDTSDDSTYRVSSGMPNGWQRKRGGRRESIGSPVSPIGGNGRDSMMSGSTAIGSTAHGNGNGNGRRMRAGDLRKDANHANGYEGTGFGGGYGGPFGEDAGVGRAL